MEPVTQRTSHCHGGYRSGIPGLLIRSHCWEIDWRFPGLSPFSPEWTTNWMRFARRWVEGIKGKFVRDLLKNMRNGTLDKAFSKTRSGCHECLKRQKHFVHRFCVVFELSFRPLAEIKNCTFPKHPLWRCDEVMCARRSILSCIQLQIDHDQ